MVDTRKLEKLIELKGIKKRSLANNLHISMGTLANKINNRTEFKVSEIAKICSDLGINYEEIPQVFFIREVNLKSTEGVING